MPSRSLTDFTMSHNAAFRELGAKEPGQHWSAFDVSMDEAREGKAKRLVTTIWNFHSDKDEKGRRTPSVPGIKKDRTNGTLWYFYRKPTLDTKSPTRLAHWGRMELARDRSIPIIGVLKDVHSGRCSRSHTFDCGTPRLQIDGSAMWVELKPRGKLGCEVDRIDIGRLMEDGQKPAPLVNTIQQFEASVHESLQRSAEDRRARLAIARRIPNEIETVTTGFDRNPDVVAEVLIRGNGVCEGCGKPAPFVRRSDGSPYLEVHHRILLANGGEDTVENAVALCPNCHRAAHYG